MPALDIAVIGCGTAGPAAAVLLRRAGHRVTVFEAVPAFGPVGAGLLLQPTGLAVLARLGVHAAIAGHGAPVDRLICHTRGGWTVLDLGYGEIGPGACGVGIHRAVLLHHLVEAVRAEEIPIRLGTSIVDIAPAAPSERPDRTPGDRLAPPGALVLGDDQGAQHGPFELVIVADGARSALRARAGLRARVSPYPWGALWFIGRDPEDRFAGHLAQFVDGAARMVGFLPTGLDLAREAPLVSLFYSVRLDAVDALRRAGLAAWKDQIDDLCGDFGAPLVDQIDDLDQLTLAPYFDVRMRPWHRGRVVVLGDAAHATSPQLGQGANLALCDAAALADCLSEHAGPDAALADYTRRRRHPLGYYQWASRWLTPFFQSRSRALGWLRDLGFGAMTRIRPLRRKMTRTMAGLERGLVRPGLPLPALPPGAPEAAPRA